MFAVAISLLSLFVAFANFYFPHMRKLSKSSMIVVYGNNTVSTRLPVSQDYSTNLEFGIIIMNEGNQSLAILDLSLRYSLDNGSHIRSVGPSSFIVEPGSIVQKSVSEDMKILISNLRSSGVDCSDIDIAVDVVVPGGDIDRQIHRLGSITMMSPDDSTSSCIQVQFTRASGSISLVNRGNLNGIGEYIYPATT